MKSTASPTQARRNAAAAAAQEAARVKAVEAAAYARRVAEARSTPAPSGN